MWEMLVPLLSSLFQMGAGPGIARGQTKQTIGEMLDILPEYQNYASTYAPPMGIRPFYDQGTNRVQYERPLLPSALEQQTAIYSGQPIDLQQNMMNRLNQRRQMPFYQPAESSNQGLFGGLFG